MKPTSEIPKRWLGFKVMCWVRNQRGEREGLYIGIVRGLSTNEAVRQAEGQTTYDFTGLLVDIPELGRNATYGEWPVRFDDALPIKVGVDMVREFPN